MNTLKLLPTLLLIIVVLETALLVVPYLSKSTTSYSAGPVQSFTFPASVFNQPISNDTDNELKPSYNASWEVSIESSLAPVQASRSSEAQIAMAPNFKTENLSIPTIIVQERADGLVRIEYYAQDWNNTFGLVLYNSTSPTWLGDQNITLRFIAFGPPSQVNPQIAPRPNGNLTIYFGNQVVLLNYPIAWASMAHIFMYGLAGSSFTDGSMAVSFRSLSKE